MQPELENILNYLLCLGFKRGAILESDHIVKKLKKSWLLDEDNHQLENLGNIQFATKVLKFSKSIFNQKGKVKKANQNDCDNHNQKMIFQICQETVHHLPPKNVAKVKNAL